MADRRGNEALALIQNKEFIGRMNGLINLYTIDPSDAEVKRELTALRRQMGQIWLDLNPQQLQALYQSSFGQMFRNFLGSGFSREPLAEDDQALRSQLVPFVSNMSQPKASMHCWQPCHSSKQVGFSSVEVSVSSPAGCCKTSKPLMDNRCQPDHHQTRGSIVIFLPHQPPGQPGNQRQPQQNQQ